MQSSKKGFAVASGMVRGEHWRNVGKTGEGNLFTDTGNKVIIREGMKQGSMGEDYKW